MNKEKLIKSIKAVIKKNEENLDNENWVIQAIAENIDIRAGAEIDILEWVLLQIENNI